MSLFLFVACSSNEEEQSAGKRPIVFGSVLADVHEGRATLATNLGGTIGIFGYKYAKDTWTGTTETYASLVMHLRQPSVALMALLRHQLH